MPAAMVVTSSWRIEELDHVIALAMAMEPRLLGQVARARR